MLCKLIIHTRCIYLDIRIRLAKSSETVPAGADRENFDAFGAPFAEEIDGRVHGSGCTFVQDVGFQMGVIGSNLEWSEHDSPEAHAGPNPQVAIIGSSTTQRSTSIVLGSLL